MASSLCAGFFFFLYLPTFLKHTLKVSKLLSRMHEEWCSLPMVPKALKKSQTLKAIGLVWCPVPVGQRKTILVWMVFIRCLSRTAVHCAFKVVIHYCSLRMQKAVNSFTGVATIQPIGFSLCYYSVMNFGKMVCLCGFFS